MWRSYFTEKKWLLWSWGGSVFIILSLLAQTYIDVKINEWYKGFYDLLQKAPERELSEFYVGLKIFMQLAIPYVIIITITNYFTKLWAFRWREAMTFSYMPYWRAVDAKVEGASQRIQEDTMRFAAIMEGLGVAFVDSIMTLIAFLPVLAALSVHVESLPILGAIPYPLVTLSIVWSIFGTLILLFAGIKLPGLEFRNQRVEAAFRKELVLGEDNEANAQPIALRDLFSNVRKNYFRIYLHYTYFNLFRYMYIQADNVIAYVFLIPTIVSGRITLGIMNQILRAFGQVASSFQFLVSSWTTIIELISIYKRLKAFEAAINDQPLPKIDRDFVEDGSKEV